MGKTISFDVMTILLQRGIIKKGTFITSVRLSKDDMDLFYICGIKVGKEKYFFDIKEVDGHRTGHISQDEIILVEGSKLVDLPSIYEIDCNPLYEVSIETDVVNDVIGKSQAMIDSHQLCNGYKFILKNDKSEKYCNRILTVSGVSKEIKLSAGRGRPKKVK